MSDPAISPEVSHEDQFDDQVDEEQIEQEQVDIGDEEPEDIADEEVEGEADPEEDEKTEGQEGLDLDMTEEDGIGYQDEPDGEAEVIVSERAYDDPNVHDKDGAKVENGKEVPVVHDEEIHVEEKESKEDKHDEDPLALPPHGSEVFVGGLSKDTVEDDLREICSPHGDIFKVRIVRDKGFAFVTFTNRESAENAIKMLNGHDLNGRKIRFSASQSRYRLFVGNIPKIWDNEELEKALADKGAGIESVDLPKDLQNSNRNRGFAFVEYHNHACADKARRNLSLPGFKLGGNTPTISWAEPRGGSDNPTMSQVKVVYVRNLPDNATQEELCKLFEHHGEITKVVLPPSKPGQAKRDFGFIHFADRSSALKAIEKTEKYELEGRVLETSLARAPPEKRETLYQPLRGGLLPHYQSRAGYGYSGSHMYGAAGSGFGSSRGYGQPVIYGRGPAPAGMAMVPMMLPDGRVGYVLQQSGGQGGSVSYRDSRGGRGSQSQHHNSGNTGSSRRYRPY